uniref:Uncharacterized protein n=1 Tax=Panagrolaimus sp. PS1159 TaxID=55785 RepID=A0AC35G028_9BILA
MAELENGPFAIVTQEFCNAAFAMYQNDPQEFMCRIIRRHFGHAELILNYEMLHALKGNVLETIHLIFCHYFGVNVNNNGLAQQVTKNALAKCRSYRRQRLYQAIQYSLDQNFIAITSDDKYFFYGPHNEDETFLAPFEDAECDERLETAYYFGEQNFSKFGIPKLYRNREFIVVVEKEDDKIVISYIEPQPKFIDLIYTKNNY